MLALLQLAIVALAAAAAGLTPPRAWVERDFSNDLYPVVQAAITSTSNLTPVPLFDVIVFAVIAAAVAIWIRHGRRAWHGRRLGPVATAVRLTAVLAAVVYLWFLGAWGLNYRRVPVDESPAFDAARVTAPALRTLAARAVQEANDRYALAHQEGFAAGDAVPAPLVRALHEVEASLGRPRATVPARPKRSAFTPFFRAAGVDGMLAPFALETLLNPDLTGPERPAVLAHEWAHLSGYASEDEASFVGLLAALQADRPSQYSAWLALVFDTTALLTTPERQHLLGMLDEGPRRDQQAIIARLARRVQAVEQVSWTAYDGYLKSQGVEEGIRSYGGVVRLLIGRGMMR